MSEVVLDRFERVARVHPGHTAIVDGDRILTYGQLDEMSDRVAARLQRRGTGPGSLVPVNARRSADLVIALAGITKAGAAYVPVDIGYPVKRRRAIIEQIGADAVLATSAEAGTATTIESITRDAARIQARPVTLSGADAAYVIFTSGTTGGQHGPPMPARAGIAGEHGFCRSAAGLPADLTGAGLRIIKSPVRALRANANPEPAD